MSHTSSSLPQRIGTLFAIAALVGAGCAASDGPSEQTVPPTPPATCTMGGACEGPLSNSLSCTGGAQPAVDLPNQWCSETGSSNGTTTYCCQPTYPRCTPYSLGDACQKLDPSAAWTGYACSASAVPTGDNYPGVCWNMPAQSLVAAKAYCCTDGPSTGGCYPDPAANCDLGYVGYDCKGSESFNNIGSTFNCSDGTPPFCCSTLGTYANPCTVIAQTADCTGLATSYSCFGVDRPEKTNPSLACEAGTIGPNSAQTTYCCFGYTSSACSVSHSVIDCSAPGLYGFSCSGAARPEQSDSSLTCSVGVVGASGSKDFCCTRH
jgi:hypothetical protein